MTSHTCYLCCAQKTQMVVSVANHFSGCLPVCHYCVPPWINSNTDPFWYEKLLPDGGQEKPNETMVKTLLFSRREGRPANQVKDMTLVETAPRYRKKFNIDDLLACWHEDSQTYVFTSL